MPRHVPPFNGSFVPRKICLNDASLWKHSLQLCEFRNDKSQKDEVRYVAEYKQHALDDKICEAYHKKYTLLHPMNPLQEQLFDIQIDELPIMPYNIRKHGYNQPPFICEELKCTTC
jgi:hypothetical protein